MFQKFIFIITFISLLFSNINSKTRNEEGGNDKTNISEVRELFYRAVESESSLDSLEVYLKDKSYEGSEEKDALLTAYAGAAESLKAKYAFWPFSKLSYLKSGVKIMTDAVKKSPDNLEVRFLRFSVLHHVPGFLGYGDLLRADADKIVALLSESRHQNEDIKLRNNVAEFMIKSGRLSGEMREKLLKEYMTADSK